MRKTYIIGHKKPDTDSVTSAICLSYLKNKLGNDTIPMVLGDINNETKFVLNYFNVVTPKYLNDVKLQVKDLKYGKDNFVGSETSILDTFEYMEKNSISNIPIVDKNQKYLGLVSMKDILRNIIKGDFEQLKTSYDNILNVLKAKQLLRYDEFIAGNIIVASYKSTTFIENIDLNEDDILIVGDRHSIIEYAIERKVKLLILTGGSKIKEKHLEIAKKNKVNIIETDLRTFHAAKTITLSNPISSLMNIKDIILFNENDDVNDFLDIANKTKYSYFPVINNENVCLGFIKLAHVADKDRKKVILVDHNEYEQSVDGIEEAEIVEIIDHHKIGKIATNAPINFRNMPVGSTNTIIYLLYKENQIKIPKNLAGLMMAGIISDTLLFSSPTTTEIDKNSVIELSKICGVDYSTFALEMFKAGSSLKDKTVDEIFYTDFKNFSIDNKKIGISQVSTINVDDIINSSKQYIDLMNNLAKLNNYYIAALFVTDILNNGSYIFYNETAQEFLDNCFGLDLVQGKFLPGIVSRKKQVIPVIMEKM